MLSHINVYTDEDITIHQLAETIREIVEFKGELQFDTTKPDGTPKKLMDVTRLNELGWKAKIELHERLKTTSQWLLENQDHIRS